MITRRVLFCEETSLAERAHIVGSAAASVRFNYHEVSAAVVHIPNEMAMSRIKKDQRVTAIIPDRPVHTHKPNPVGAIFSNGLLSQTTLTVLISHSARLSHGLMVNDSLIIAGMQEAGINSLATNDRGFPGLKDFLFMFLRT